MSQKLVTLLDKTDKDIQKVLLEIPRKAEMSTDQVGVLRAALTKIASRIRNADLKSEEIPDEWLEN